VLFTAFAVIGVRRACEKAHCKHEQAYKDTWTEVREFFEEIITNERSQKIRFEKGKQACYSGYKFSTIESRCVPNSDFCKIHFGTAGRFDFRARECTCRAGYSIIKNKCQPTVEDEKSAGAPTEEENHISPEEPLGLLQSEEATADNESKDDIRSQALAYAIGNEYRYTRVGVFLVKSPQQDGQKAIQWKLRNISKQRQTSDYLLRTWSKNMVPQREEAFLSGLPLRLLLQIQDYYVRITALSSTGKVLGEVLFEIDGE